MDSIGTHKAIDVWCNKNSSFFKDDKGELYAFGQNTYGQLGIGSLLNTARPTKVVELSGINIVDLSGG
jgi:alpha-tubulin suppressor-like RCC1 family protein